MSGRTTQKCKETLLQAKERLKREQANRTSKRVRELLDSRNRDSESDSDEEQSSSIDGSGDTLSLLGETCISACSGCFFSLCYNTIGLVVLV